ncbi:MAG: APC family permease [Clostridiales bacterium]|nr:APC family permease [Clostridiales bacterium]
MKNKYSLFTAITMITGVVIGSGIFFKADDILVYTNGNMLLGIGIFIAAATAIVFGCLTIAQLAMKTDNPGGIVAYAEEFVNEGVSRSFGWFQTFLYLPAISAVVAWVTGMYFCQLFNIESSLETWTLIGVIVLILLFALNVLSAKLGGMFQNASMIIKLVPLLLLAIVGLFFGKPGSIIVNDISTMKVATSSGGWITAFAPIAFSFDGWIVSTSICHEIKDSKRSFPIALSVAPFLILLAYVSYFVGLTSLLGTETVLSNGNDSVFLASRFLFGDFGAKIVLLFVVISVLGTVNGLVLGYIRMPYSLAIRNMVPFSKLLKKEDKRLNGMPLNSAIFAFIISMIWMLLHYITQKIGMRGDVSEIAIAVSYLNYIILYITVMKMAKKGEIKGKISGYLFPALAILGSIIILSGSITNPMFPYYFIICISIMIAGYLWKFKA